MPTITEAIQAKIRSITGFSLDYEGDWHAYLDQKSIPPGMFNERVLAFAKSQDATIPTYSAAINHFSNVNNITSNQSRLDQSVAIVTSYGGSLWIADPLYCFTDAAGTIPCKNGDPVYRMNDLCGTMHATQPNLALRPYLRQIGGLWALEFLAVGDFMDVSARGSTLIGVNYTILSGFQSFQTAGPATMFAGTDAGANANLSVTQQSNGVVVLDQGSNSLNGGINKPLGSKVIATAYLDSANMYFRVNKTQTSKANTLKLTTNNGWRMGTGNGDQIQYIYAAMAAPAQMSIGDINTLEDNLAYRLGGTT